MCVALTRSKAIADGLIRAHPNGWARINPSALFCPSTTAGSRARQLPATALIWLAMCVALTRSKAVADGLIRAHPNGWARINPSALFCPSTTAGSRARQLPATTLIWLAMCVALENSEVVTFSYAAAYSACRSHSAFSIPPCGRVPSPQC